MTLAYTTFNIIVMVKSARLAKKQGRTSHCILQLHELVELDTAEKDGKMTSGYSRRIVEWLPKQLSLAANPGIAPIDLREALKFTFVPVEG